MLSLSACTLPRYVQLSERHLLVFGGVNRRVRYNDLWLFDAAGDGGKGTWTRVDAEGVPPSPRAHFSAVRFGDGVYIFGGYSGGGQVLGDTWLLHCGADGFRWEELTGGLQGEAPPPRFDHTAFVFPIAPNSDTFDKMVIMGGRDVTSVLSDAHTLDLATLTWERAPDGGAGVPAPGAEVCCAAVEDVESVPYHKVRAQSESAWAAWAKAWAHAVKQ